MLPYKTWEWLAPTVLLTAWLVVPVVTVELFLSGIHNEVKQNLLKSKTTMKRMKSNVRRARELNESDEEDLDIDVHEEERDDELEYELKAAEDAEGGGESIEVDVETPLDPKGRKRAAKPSKTRSKSSGKTEIVVKERERVHFPMDPRLNPKELLFMRGLTDQLISKRVAGQNKLRQNAASQRPGQTQQFQKQPKGVLFVQYIRTKAVLEGVIFLYEAFNLWSCLFVYSIEWPKLAPSQAFTYGSFKSLELYKGMYNGTESPERVVFYLVLSFFFIAACAMLTKDATVGPKTIQKHNIALRNRLVTSGSWKEFFFGRKGSGGVGAGKSARISIAHGQAAVKGMAPLKWREIRYHATIFSQYLFFELLFMPGLSLALVVLNCEPGREVAGDPNSRRVYYFRPSLLSSGAGSQEECWEGGHGTDSIVGVLMAVVIYTCAIYHKRQKMRKASTIVFNFMFEIFYSMIKALLTVAAVCFPSAGDGDFLLWSCLGCFVVLEVVNHLLQPCKGYGTLTNSYRASTFAVGTITSVLAILVNKTFHKDETKNIAAAIWIAMILPVVGFAYEYNMLCSSLASGDVPEDKTVADLLQFQEREGRKTAIVGGLNVQRIAGSCVARLFHIDPRARDVAVLSQIMLEQSTRSRVSLGNLNHGLAGVFGFFAPSEVTKNVALTTSTIAHEDGDYLLSQELDSRSGVRKKITRSQGRVLSGHVLQNQNMVEISVNASRLLYPIPVEALKEGKLGHFDWYDATTGESEIVKGVMDYVYNTFGSKALPKTITFGKTPTRMTRLIQDYDLAHKSSMMQTDEVGLVNIESDCVTVDVKSLIDPLDFDSSGDFADTFALDLSKHFLTTADWILLEPLIVRNRCLQSLDLSENCLDAESLPLLASLFREQKQNSRFKDLVLYGNPLSKRAKLDWQTGRETVEEEWEELFRLGQALAYYKQLRMVVVEKAQKIDLSDAEKVTRMKLGGSEFDFDARVGDPTCVLLSSLLPRYANLYELDLSKNDISDKGLHYLATRALSPDFVDGAWACRVAVLNLSENQIGDEGLVSLATAMKRNEFLTKIDLSRNKFTSAGVKFLSKGLVRSKYNNLQELILEDNQQLGQGALDPIFEVLSRLDPSGSDCSTLKSLSISGIKLFSTGCVKLGQMLSRNGTLEHLSVSNCGLDEPPPKVLPKPKSKKEYRELVKQQRREEEEERRSSSSKKAAPRPRDDSGLRLLCQSLQMNSSLRTLDLSQNGLVTQDFVASVIYLNANPKTKLEHLKVNDNNIGISMAQFRPLIIEEVLPNQALRRVDLWSNPTEHGVVRELAALMKRKAPSQAIQFH